VGQPSKCLTFNVRQRKMKRSYTIVLFLVISALFIAGEVSLSRERKGLGTTLITVSVILLLPFARIVFLGAVNRRNSSSASDSLLPPPKDIGIIRAGSAILSSQQKDRLLQAIARAKRAQKTSKITREIPFQIEDHWGGIWDLYAYEDLDGMKGFSINRIYFSGPHAQIVAECIGI
jgi:hypothetical protein